MSQTNVNLFFISVKNPLRRFDEDATQACKLALKKGEKEWKGRRKRYKSNPKTKSITKIGDWAKQSINKPNQRSQWKIGLITPFDLVTKVPTIPLQLYSIYSI